MKSLILIFSLILTLVSCQGQDIKPETFAENACDCFEKQTNGDIDSRLDPCFSKPISDQFVEIHKVYYTNLPEEVAIKKYMTDVMVLMIKNCDKFYIELDIMYINFFPEIKIETVEKDLAVMKDSLSNNLVPDSIKIKLLNKRVNLLTKARKFDEAMKEIAILDKQYGRKNDNYFIKAYIFKSKGNYKGALIEINNLLHTNQNDEFIIFQAILTRKLNGS
jgi:hypothetical protein